MAEPLPIARRGDVVCELLPSMANRHGLVTGATGTGKTVTLQTLAEGFSRIGVPVFLADVKGDLAGIGKAFGQHLQGDRLAGAGGAGDEAMSVGELELQVLGLDAAAVEDLALLHQRFALYHGFAAPQGGATHAPPIDALITRPPHIGNAWLHVHRGDNRG